MKNKKEGFTLIEVLIVVAIISILATITFVLMGNTKKNARLNNTKTVLKTAILAVYSCNDAGSVVSIPSGTEDGTKVICPAAAGSFWPALQGGYTYNAGGNFSSGCSFSIDTHGDSASDLTCSCSTQICS
jgi:prepilin-type N-terminal cleavage/methylation domain-containing protein